MEELIVLDREKRVPEAGKAEDARTNDAGPAQKETAPSRRPHQDSKSAVCLLFRIRGILSRLKNS